MAELFYREDRDIDFMNACEKVRQESNEHLSVAEIVRKAILQPAKSFYLRPREYGDIVRRAKKKLPKREVTRELYAEILNRYNTLREEYPSLKNQDINKMLSEQVAPRFYISEARGILLYYELMKK